MNGWYAGIARITGEEGQQGPILTYALKAKKRRSTLFLSRINGSNAAA